MKKFMIIITFCVIFTFGLAACGTNKDHDEKPVQGSETEQGSKTEADSKAKQDSEAEPDNETEQTGKNDKEQPETEKADVEDNDGKNENEKEETGMNQNESGKTANESDTVEITIPASFYESLGITPTQEELEKEMQGELDTEYVLNPDGSVTCKMSREAYDQKITQVLAEVQKAIDDILADKESYPSITKITANEDFSEYTVTTSRASREEFSATENLIDFALTLTPLAYHMFLENPPDKVIIHYVNSESGEEIYTYDSSAD